MSHTNPQESPSPTREVREANKAETEEIPSHPHNPVDLSYHISEDGDYELCMVCGAVITKNVLTTTRQAARDELVDEIVKALPTVMIQGCSEHLFGALDCKRWYRCPYIYEQNEAIKRVEALLSKKKGKSSE